MPFLVQILLWLAGASAVVFGGYEVINNTEFGQNIKNFVYQENISEQAGEVFQNDGENEVQKNAIKVGEKDREKFLAELNEINSKVYQEQEKLVKEYTKYLELKGKLTKKIVEGFNCAQEKGVDMNKEIFELEKMKELEKIKEVKKNLPKKSKPKIEKKPEVIETPKKIEKVEEPKKEVVVEEEKEKIVEPVVVEEKEDVVEEPVSSRF